MHCQSCGRDNPQGSVFCQGCGVRLVDTNARRGTPAYGDSAVPPTGVVQVSKGASWQMPQAGTDTGWRNEAASPPAPEALIVCARCGASNAASMRFCKDCGLRLSADAPTPHSPPPRMHSDVPPAAAASAPVCLRCRGIGDFGAAFCKFCGAAYEPSATGNVPAARASTAWSPPQQGSSAGQTAAAITQAQLVAILKDGSDGPVYPLAGEQVDIGRTEGEIILTDDPYLSPRHARVRRRGESFVLRDLESLNGTFIRLRDSADISDGDVLLVGQQLLRFELLDDGELPIGPATQNGVLVFGTPEAPRIARLVQYTTEGIGRDVFHLYRDETVLGRENGDIVFSDDPFMSRRHASITVDRATKRFVARDLGSSNGTALRLRGEKVLVHGEQFRLGRHLFRFDIRGARGAR